MPDPIVQTWNALSGRLEAFLATHDRFIALPSSSVNGSQERALLQAAIQLAIDFLEFRSALLATSPPMSLPAFDDARLRQLVSGALDDSLSTQRAAHSAELALLLSLLRNDIDSTVRDGQEVIRLRAERALLHLQWSIAASKAVRISWIRAFNTDEPACEALGATHLLSHGIFAFKATSPAARTDLVFHEPVDVDRANVVSDGLVLTEWKRLTDERKLQEIVDAADTQADLYAGGVLAGSELRNVRYVIVVTKEQLAMPASTRRDRYIIEHKNIAVQPSSPSVAAPRLAKK